MKFDRSRYVLALPLLAAVAALAALVFWLARPLAEAVSERLPGADQPPGAEGAATLNPILAGKLIPGNALPTNLPALPGLWPQFRGPNRDGISPETTPLARSWDAAGPRQLWAVDCGEGYAGPVVRDGRVYLMDYDYDKKQNALRCLSLADGGEIWRYAYTSAGQAQPRDDPHRAGARGPIRRRDGPQVPRALPGRGHGGIALGNEPGLRIWSDGSAVVRRPMPADRRGLRHSGARRPRCPARRRGPGHRKAALARAQSA